MLNLKLQKYKDNAEKIKDFRDKIAAVKAELSKDFVGQTEIVDNVIIAIIAGNLPLQGTRLFVIIASSFSLFESIILQPTTPAALHPKPIHIVSACFPQLWHFLKGLSSKWL